MSVPQVPTERAADVTRVVRRRGAAAVRLVRLFLLGATVSYALVGAATADGDASMPRVLDLVLLGVATHVHAAIVNDVVDYPVDRTEPRRSDSPLVRGDVTRSAALALGMLSLAAGACLMGAMGASARAWLAWWLAICLVDGYSLVGKRLRCAAVSDWAQGIGTACFVAVGATLTGSATAVTVAAMTYVAGYVAMVNGVHGTVRDLANDAAHGARTTALMFGVTIDATGAVALPRRFLIWAAALQLWLLVAVVAVFVLSLGVMTAASGVGAFLSGLALASAMLWSGAAALRHRVDRYAMMSHGTWHIVFSLALLVGVVVWVMPWWMATVTVASFVLPPRLFGWAVAREQPAAHGPDVTT